MTDSLKYFEEGIEDGIESLDPRPPALFYDEYIAGYVEGQKIRADPVWQKRYKQGLEDGKENKDPTIPTSKAYMRGYDDGVVTHYLEIETTTLEELAEDNHHE